MKSIRRDAQSVKEQRGGYEARLPGRWLSGGRGFEYVEICRRLPPRSPAGGALRESRYVSSAYV